MRRLYIRYIGYFQNSSALFVMAVSFSSSSFLFASSFFLSESLPTITGSPKMMTAFENGYGIIKLSQELRIFFLRRCM